MSTEPRSVLVQAFVAGLHDLLPHGVSLSTVHCTHTLVSVPASAAGSVLQTVVPLRCKQSALPEQGSHLPAMQAEAVAFLQSLELKHSTQVLLIVSQRDATPWQFELPVHWTQVFVAVLQAGVAPEQFALLVHWTQRLVVVLHAGVGEEQLLLLMHCTQVYVARLQAGVGTEQ